MNYNNKMNNNSNNYDNKMNIDSSSSILVAEAVLCTPTQKHQPGTALYKLAARNLREYHGVPSMTALKLEKTVALLGLRPRRIVVQGLAPRRLLRGGKGGSSPLVLANDSSGETGALVDENLLINNSSSSSSSSEDEDEEEDDSNSSYDDNIHDNLADDSSDDTTGDVEGSDADGNGYGDGKARRPIHAALVAGGINLRPRETRPLLCALGVSPHRLVKLCLVKREAVRTMADGREGGRGGGRGQYLRTDRAGKRGVVGPSFGFGRSRPMLGPARRPFHGAGHHTMHLGEESEEEGMPAPLGPHGGSGHRSPRHQIGCLQGPPRGPGHHHSMPTGRHGHGPTGGGKRGHGRCHPPHGGELGHDGAGIHSEEEGRAGGERLRAARGHGPRAPRHSRREGMGRSRGHPRGPPHGSPAGPFHGGAPGASPGMVMANPRHGLPSRGGADLKQRDGRHTGGTRFCGGGSRDGGGAMRHGRMAHLAQCDGRH